MKVGSSSNLSINGSSILSKFNGTKAAQDKADRQMKRDNQVNFLEDSIKNLKNIQMSPERKLEMFHDLKNQVTEVKMSYNYEQVFHAMEEAIEQGKKIAEEAKKNTPKTPEERREEQVKEALGIDGEDGIPDEISGNIMEQMADSADELTEQNIENEKDITESIKEVIEKIIEEKLEELPPAEEHVDRMKYPPIDIKV